MTAVSGVRAMMSYLPLVTPVSLTNLEQEFSRHSVAVKHVIVVRGNCLKS
jgi:hypothetical protein